jgi:hypothetical protein
MMTTITTTTTMAFVRPLGPYLLAGSALHSQTRSVYYVSKMKTLASDALLLTMAADTEISESIVLQSKSAISSEEGLTLQSNAAELESEAKRESMKAITEKTMGDTYKTESHEMEVASDKDILASETNFAKAEEASIKGARLHTKAITEGEKSAHDLDTSVADAAGSVKAIEVATTAEENAIEYGTVVAKDIVKTAKDGEALVKTETGAMEDVEIMAACAPIPLINAVCEAIGSAVEVGYQSVAAVEGAKAAIDSISAAAARGRERAELILATEKREEAERLAIEAEELQVQADEEGVQATIDEGYATDMDVTAGEETALGEEELEASEQEKTMAATLKEKATEQYAKAARDESIAAEEETSAIAIESEANELLSSSTKDEFESLEEKADATAKDTEAEGLVKQSLGYGLRAFGFVIHSIFTAGLVAYIIIMNGLTKTVVPSIGQLWRGESQLLSTVQLQAYCIDFLIHFGIVLGIIATLPNILLNFETTSASLRIKSLFIVAALAGGVESVVKGVATGSTIASGSLGFISNLVLSVPVYMMELLIAVVLFGPGVFGDIQLVHMKVFIWCGILVLMLLSIWVVKRSTEKDNYTQDRGECIEEGESDLLCAESREIPHALADDMNKEYGSLEEVSLLSTSDEHKSNTSDQIMINSSSKRRIPINETSTTSGNCLGWCKQCLINYCSSLHLTTDLLALCLMVTLLCNCWPLINVLHPMTDKLLGAIATWISLPIILGVTVVMVIIAHIVFVA